MNHAQESLASNSRVPHSVFARNRETVAQGTHFSAGESRANPPQDGQIGPGRTELTEAAQSHKITLRQVAALHGRHFDFWTSFDL
jgi:hypothetical protein